MYDLSLWIDGAAKATIVEFSGWVLDPMLEPLTYLKANDIKAIIV